MKEYINNNIDREGGRFFQKEEIKINDENFENNVLKELNDSFENDIDLEKFLSKKIEGLYEVDNLLDNSEESKNEEKKEVKGVVENLNNNKEKEDNKRVKALEEIINIFRKSLGDKTFRFIQSPFKRLLKPKKISLAGKILLNIH